MNKAEVTKEEFEEFIRNYPKLLKRSGYNDIENFNDFTLGGWPECTIGQIHYNLFPGGKVTYYVCK